MRPAELLALQELYDTPAEARAALDHGRINETLTRQYRGLELTATVLGGIPTASYALHVEAATVEVIRVADGDVSSRRAGSI